MAVLTLDFSYFFACLGNANFPGQKFGGCWINTILPNSGILNHYWEMACWSNVNSLRVNFNFSIPHHSSINWQPDLGIVIGGYLGAFLALSFSIQ